MARATSASKCIFLGRLRFTLTQNMRKPRYIGSNVVPE